MYRLYGYAGPDEINEFWPEFEHASERLFDLLERYSSDLDLNIIEVDDEA